MLTSQEKKKLVELLNKITQPHLGLPQEVFDALIKIVPFIACELAIVNDKKELLLTWRNDKYWCGWHFPGGLLRFRESFDERIQAVAREELDVHISNYAFLQPFNYLDGPRGHVVNLLFLCQTLDTPKSGRWFKKAPKNIIGHHREFFEKAETSLPKFFNKIKTK